MTARRQAGGVRATDTVALDGGGGVAWSPVVEKSSCKTGVGRVM
jgi:hypothetical protein